MVTIQPISLAKTSIFPANSSSIIPVFTRRWFAPIASRVCRTRRIAQCATKHIIQTAHNAKGRADEQPPRAGFESAVDPVAEQARAREGRRQLRSHAGQPCRGRSLRRFRRHDGLRLPPGNTTLCKNAQCRPKKSGRTTPPLVDQIAPSGHRAPHPSNPRELVNLGTVQIGLPDARADAYTAIPKVEFELGATYPKYGSLEMNRMGLR